MIGRKAGGLAAGRRVRKPLRHVRLKILDRHARRKRHRVFVEPADVEFVRRRHVVDQVALLLQHAPVVRDEIHERRGRSEQVVALPAAGVVRRDELRARIDRHAERRLGRRGGRRARSPRRRAVPAEPAAPAEAAGWAAAAAGSRRAGPRERLRHRLPLRQRRARSARRTATTHGAELYRPRNRRRTAQAS